MAIGSVSSSGSVNQVQVAPKASEDVKKKNDEVDSESKTDKESEKSKSVSDDGSKKLATA